MSNEWVGGCTTLLTLAIETDSGHTCSRLGQVQFLRPLPTWGGGCCYGAGMRKWYLMVPATKMAGGTRAFPPTALPGCRCHPPPPGPSVPNPRRVILVNRKVQDSVADGIFHHRIVAAHGVGAFRKGGPSNLGERRGFSSHPSFPNPSSLPWPLTPQASPQDSSHPASLGFFA